MLALLSAAGVYLLLNARKLSEFEWQVRWGWLALATTAVIIVGPLIRTWLWQLVLARLGVALPFAECFRIVRLSQLAKYIPGQVWHYVSTFYLTNRAGATRGTSLSAMLYDNGASFVAAALVVIILAALFTPLSGYVAIWVVASVNLAIGVVFLLPPLFSKVAGLVFRILKRPPPPSLPTLRPSTIAILVLLNGGFWIILGGSVFFLVRGVAHPGIPFSEVVVIGSIGVMAGFIAPFAPSGIGVTEGLLVFLLQRYFPLEVSVAIALLFRVLNISKEIVLGLVAVKIDPRTPAGRESAPLVASAVTNPDDR